MKKNYKETLAYKVAFEFHGQEIFRIGKKAYQYVSTVYDPRYDGRGSNTVAIFYDFKLQQYVAWNMDDPRYGSKQVAI